MRKQILAIVLVLMLGLYGCSDNKMTQTKEPTEKTTGITKTAEVENTESFLSSESKQEDTAEAPENAENSESPAQKAEPEKTNPQTVTSRLPQALQKHPCRKQPMTSSSIWKASKPTASASVGQWGLLWTLPSHRATQPIGTPWRQHRIIKVPP